MNSRESHGPDCTCAECILGEDEHIVDLTSSVNIEEVYALNEKEEQSCKKIFKSKEQMLDHSIFCRSNDDDPDLLIYIPFSTQVKIRSMTMIGGEDGTSPKKIKLFVNHHNPDFDLKDLKPTQEINCVENPEGKLPYFMSPTKFNNVWSITLIVTMNWDADFTKISCINFEGISTHKKQKFKLQIFDMAKNKDKVDQVKETHLGNENLIYG